jgi:CRISPR/Cas system-associated endoribonuclease Cas2
MSNFRYNKSNLKKLSRNSLYKMLYSVYVSSLTRGQIVNELELRIPHHKWIDKENIEHRLFDKYQNDYQILMHSVWEIEQSDLTIQPINGVQPQ